ncbi:hypothetical protein [Sphingopyxis flava]|uniref:DUF4350 domain-containing protein n=1 Tax=Sphingopyxis flava TaxID=1507287 RepID=A0A1T5CZ55_9SPHN|nr:hypothetical protein [Sphingopyxis flava]SKB64621.1 hypothetical protein SAMN06295937_101236 [Sphingopyxis flava]
MTDAPSDSSFNPRLIGGVVAVGVAAFIALWALIALGPQLSGGKDGGGHALSKGAPGYAAMIDLLERAGAQVEVRRRVEPYRYQDYTQLAVLTPTHETRPGAMQEILAAQAGAPILIVLPKWQVLQTPGERKKPGWSGPGFRAAAPTRLLPADWFGETEVESEAAKSARGRAILAGRAIDIPLPDEVQTLSGPHLEALIVAPGGGAVLARTKNRDIYILADPDLIDNLAFASRDTARAGAMLLDAISEDADADGFAFDVTLNGFGSQRSLLRFAFVPPFIGITLCLIAAGLLALWQAAMRFGPALRPARAIPVSKAALIANSADLIKQAGRELDSADAYVLNQRAAIARRLHAPAGLDASAIDAWIDRRLTGHNGGFSALARRLPLARSAPEFLADAQALHDIRKDLLRDG